MICVNTCASCAPELLRESDCNLFCTMCPDARHACVPSCNRARMYIQRDAQAGLLCTIQLQQLLLPYLCNMRCSAFLSCVLACPLPLRPECQPSLLLHWAPTPALSCGRAAPGSLSRVLMAF